MVQCWSLKKFYLHSISMIFRLIQNVRLYRKLNTNVRNHFRNVHFFRFHPALSHCGAFVWLLGSKTCITIGHTLSQFSAPAQNDCRVGTEHYTTHFKGRPEQLNPSNVGMFQRSTDVKARSHCSGCLWSLVERNNFSLFWISSHFVPHKSIMIAFTLVIIAFFSVH